MFSEDHLLILACIAFSTVAVGTIGIEITAFVRKVRYQPRHGRPLLISYAEDAITVSWLKALPRWDDRQPAPASMSHKRSALRILVQPLRPVAIARTQQITLAAIGWYAALSLVAASATSGWPGADDVWPEWRPWNV